MEEPDDGLSGLLNGPAARFHIDSDGNEFLIERSVLAHELKQRLVDFGPGLSPQLDELMRAWSDPLEDQAPPIQNLPFRWRSFSEIALALIKAGKGCCLCPICQRPYLSGQLTVERFKAGIEYVTVSDSVRCPSGHTLLISEAHFRLRVSRPHPDQGTDQLVPISPIPQFLKRE